MRYLLLLLLSFSALMVHAQVKLVPAKNVAEKKWMTDQQYQMAWYGLRDTAKIEIGKISTSISNAKNKITVITQVNMKRANSTWIDSSVSSAVNLQPFYHSSYNAQRDMVLNFGKVITGYYNDKIKKINTIISDTTAEDYFDSNVYPTLISWLPLKDGYKQDIAIYDYNPSGKTGVIKASIQDVKKGTYKTERSGIRNVWIVTVSDEIAGGDSRSIYYIDIADRKLWKQEITAGARRMLMQLIEN